MKNRQGRTSCCRPKSPGEAGKADDWVHPLIAGGLVFPRATTGRVALPSRQTEHASRISVRLHELIIQGRLGRAATRSRAMRIPKPVDAYDTVVEKWHDDGRARLPPGGRGSCRAGGGEKSVARGSAGRLRGSPPFFNGPLATDATMSQSSRARFVSRGRHAELQWNA